MTDQEINEAVARKLGIDFRMCPIHLQTACCGRKGIPNYCHDIKAAWEITDNIPGFWLQRMNSYWNVCNYQEHDKDVLHESTRFIASADTAPMAICLAFLKIP